MTRGTTSRGAARPAGGEPRSLEPLGARPTGDGEVEVRVWAPSPDSVAVELGGRETPLEPRADGIREAVVPGGAGDDYWLVVDGERLPDPCSRWQPEGLRGPSRVLDPDAFRWTDEGWRGVALTDLVLYELHVGAFDEAGTFDGVARHLDELAALGVTAIEPMPVATFPGRRGWGYDGLYTWAAHEAYGGPHGLARLVDAAHAAGLGVVLDVVYNHLGPGSERLLAFGPYLTDRHRSPWGQGVDFDGPDALGVREWAIQNACQWARDFHVDGLRIDAVHAIEDDSPRHVLAELAERVRATRPGTLVISEMETGDLRPIRAWGHDAQWGDELHHALHVLLTGEHEGYYADYGRVADLAEALTRPEGPRLVVCTQNHDQVGNRALGDRPPRRGRELVAMLTLLSRGTPLLFMGEEHGETRPFPFFTDHDDPRIAEATREGRRREFAGFSGFAGELPDPQDEATFLAARLDRAGGDPVLRALYRDLLALRRRLVNAPVEVAYDERARWLVLRRGGVEVLANLADRDQAVGGELLRPFEGRVRQR